MAGKKRSGDHLLEFEKARIVRALYDIADKFVAGRDGGAFRASEGESLHAEFEALIAHAHSLKANGFGNDVAKAATYLSRAMVSAHDVIPDDECDS